MANKQKVTGDLGSDVVAVLREQVNRLTAFAEELKAAAVTDGNTFQANVAALTSDGDFVEIVVTPAVPRPRRFPLNAG